MKKLITALLLTALLPATGFAGEIWENNALPGETWHDDFPTTHEIAHRITGRSDLGDSVVEDVEPITQDEEEQANE